MEKVEKLKAAFESMSQVNEFKPGDIVCWKDGLQNRIVPEYDEPVVVIGVSPGCVNPEINYGSPYFNEPIELQIGLFKDEYFVVFHADQRRFRHF